MSNTYKFMAPLVSNELKELTLNELAFMYQSNNDSRILATAYVKIYKLSISISNQFWGLNEDDLDSWCLEKLDYCLRTLNPKFAFTTYFATVYRNKLREETEALNYKKRKCILVAINELITEGLEDTYNLLELMLPDTLTDREHELCILESEGYDRKYCAEQLGVSKMTISNMEKSLRVKLADLQI